MWSRALKGESPAFFIISLVLAAQHRTALLLVYGTGTSFLFYRCKYSPHFLIKPHPDFSEIPLKEKEGKRFHAF
jgi:hypothetical protein